MRVYHVSPTYNNVSIRSHGLLTRLCRDARRSIWVVGRRQLDWAIEHVRERHRSEHVTVWVVDVPRGWTTRAPHGPYTISRDVPPARIAGRLVLLSTGEMLM